MLTFSGDRGPWPVRRLSQRALKAIWEAFGHVAYDLLPDKLYECGFPDWLKTAVEQDPLDAVIIHLRNGSFFFPQGTEYIRTESITGRKLTPADAQCFAESLIQGLAALATVIAPDGQWLEVLRRQLELEGFQVDKDHLRLVDSEGPVSEVEEEERLTALVRNAAMPNEAVILAHLANARAEFIAGKEHPCLNESRNFLQALIDDVSRRNAPTALRAPSSTLMVAKPTASGPGRPGRAASHSQQCGGARSATSPNWRTEGRGRLPLRCEALREVQAL
jgi:hypothetical protein